MKRSRLFGVLMMVGSVAACIPTGVEEVNLSSNTGRWAAMRPQHYEFTYQRSGCECLAEWTVPMRVLVHDREIQSVVNIGTGQLIASTVHQAKTIDDLFDLIEEATARDAFRLAVTYDAELGYPTSIFVDFRAEVADDEAFYSARDLRAVD
jgi:hypothetical protein